MMYLECAKKVKSVLLCALFYQGLAQASSWGMPKLFGSAPDQIITPYEPSFVVWHPEISAGCGVLSTFFAALQYSSDPISSGLVSFLAIEVARRWLKMRPKLIDLLFLDPFKLHEWNRQIREDHFEDEDKKALFRKNPLQWITLVKEYEKENPIFLLSECDTAFSSNVYTTNISNVFICSLGCALSRSSNPHRATFEDRVVQKILLHQKTNKKLFWWVSFGCGGLFPELATLAKTFAKNPTLSMCLHLIDPIFFELMIVFDFLQSKGKCHTGYYDTAQYNDDSIIHDCAMLKSCFAFICKKYPVYFTGKEKKENVFKSKVYQQYAVLKQFTFFLRKTFPLVDLSVSIHNNVKTYLSFQDQEEGAPDLVTAVDIDDNDSVRNDAPLNYAELCIEALKKNPSSQNLWLAKKVCSVSLVTIAFNGKEEDKVENEQLGCPCYITGEIL